MITTLFGFKKDQMRLFTDNGTQIVATKILVEPSIVTRIVTNNRYQLGIGQAKYLPKPQEEQLKKAGVHKKPRFFREIEAEEDEQPLSLGSEIVISDVFQVGDMVTVTGVSKGKGFAGVVRRHGFAGGPKTHGQGDHWRAPGSIGSGTTPGRVYKGKRMAGRLGGETVTIKGLRVIAVDANNHTLTISGLIPGARGGVVKISKII